jgi:hypothetical protein
MGEMALYNFLSEWGNGIIKFFKRMGGMALYNFFKQMGGMALYNFFQSISRLGST